MSIITLADLDYLRQSLTAINLPPVIQPSCQLAHSPQSGATLTIVGSTGIRGRYLDVAVFDAAWSRRFTIHVDGWQSAGSEATTSVRTALVEALGELVKAEGTKSFIATCV